MALKLIIITIVYSDADIWWALKSVSMDEHVKSFPNKLLTEIVENGENISQGQRQLM